MSTIYQPNNINITNLSSTNLLISNTHNISTITAINNLLDTHNSNTTTKLSSNNIRKSQIKNYPKLEIGNSCLPTNFQFIKSAIRIVSVEFKNWPPTSNILPATSTKNKILAVIFSFELEEIVPILLLSGIAFNTKLITMMYTDAKVNDQSIKLIFNSGLADSIITRQLINQLSCQVDHAANTRIITANRITKTPISEIDDFLFEVNGIIILIKVLVMEAT
ncbi:hypothetical protein G9A89_013023 [Geosiphon pyriformis]|nr:hypothetical protein G9A89_013023 [Geosiphon pyriformis]